MWLTPFFYFPLKKVNKKFSILFLPLHYMISTVGASLLQITNLFSKGILLIVASSPSHPKPKSSILLKIILFSLLIVLKFISSCSPDMRKKRVYKFIKWTRIRTKHITNFSGQKFKSFSHETARSIICRKQVYSTMRSAKFLQWQHLQMTFPRLHCFTIEYSNHWFFHSLYEWASVI